TVTGVQTCALPIFAPGGDLSGVAVAGHLLLDAGDVDGAVVQPRERLRRVDAQEAPVVGDRVAAHQERAWVALGEAVDGAGGQGVRDPRGVRARTVHVLDQPVAGVHVPDELVHP